MNGFHRKMLTIDLDTEHSSINRVDNDVFETCLGGKGLGRIFY